MLKRAFVSSSAGLVLYLPLSMPPASGEYASSDTCGGGGRRGAAHGPCGKAAAGGACAAPPWSSRPVLRQHISGTVQAAPAARRLLAPRARPHRPGAHLVVPARLRQVRLVGHAHQQAVCVLCGADPGTPSKRVRHAVWNSKASGTQCRQACAQPMRPPAQPHVWSGSWAVPPPSRAGRTRSRLCASER
jgi:hypothetical protein